MKVALVILHADASRGGAERYTLDLAAALVRRGHDVSLLASSFAQAPAGIQCVSLAVAGLMRAARYRHFLDSLDRHLDQSSYEIVHAMLPVRRCHIYHPHAGVAAEALSGDHLKHDCPVTRAAARLFNRLNARRRCFAQVEEAMFATCSPAVICLSTYIRQTLLSHYSLPAEKLVTILNGVDLGRFDPAGRPAAGPELRQRLGCGSEAILALMIAQDFRRKGLPQAIEAIARIGDPRLRLVAVGKEDPAPYQRLARKLAIADRIIFPGPTADPCPFYQAADLFILPTRHDPCSLVVLEALAMGLPVISTAQNGACEVMQDGVHGCILPEANDVARLAAATASLLDPAARQRMRRSCLALRPAISSDHHIDRVVALYDSCRGKMAEVRSPMSS